tara:strand:+ start:307 stop:543 length:237 start_codon:yes stop_codon:yes gene_type:complete
MKTTSYYSVKHSGGSFANITTIVVDGNRKLITTKEEAKIVLNNFCTSDEEEHKKYWESQRPFMEVYKVIKIEERVNLD